jgi:FtsZ-binding cell division protein ZapB
LFKGGGQMKMKWRRRIVYPVLLSVSLLVICSCVSKKDYLLKVDESKKLSMDLEELKSDHNMLEEQKKACDTQVIALQGEKSDLEDEDTVATQNPFSGKGERSPKRG